MTPAIVTAPQPGSGAMFDRIARRYDLLNLLASFGLDRRWRRALVRSLGPDPRVVIDLATGTADVALAVARAHPDARVLGIDPSEAMLERGARKVARAGLAERVQLVTGDAQALALPDGGADAACMAFGIRNVPDRAAAVREMRRVVRRGGRLAVLELGEPRRGLLGPLARFHVRTVVPALGAWLSGSREYRYLASSIAAFPGPAAFCELLRAAGWEEVAVTPMTFDAAHLYTGRA